MSPHAISRLAARARLPEAVVEQALEWLVMSWSGDNDADFTAQLNNWREQHPQHEQAWQHLNRLNRQLTMLPGELAVNSLRSAEQAGSRRQLLQWAGALLLTAGSAPFALRSEFAQQHLADLRTGVGEIQQHTLPDGSQLTLNTDSAVNLHFTASERRIQLLQGELLLVTAQDTQSPPRPLQVVTAQGAVHPIGTRFTVRRLGDWTEVHVEQGLVELRASSATTAQRLPAGFSSRFDRQTIQPKAKLRQSSNWAAGLLVVEQMPLAQFITELQRYRRGVIRLHPALRGLRLTGTFSLRETERTLQMLEDALPVQLTFFTPYWLTIEPADA